MRNKRAGFTLLELTLVMAVFLILLTLAVTALEGTGSEVRTRAAADAFRSALLTARACAIDQGRPYSVGVVPGKGHYRVAPDSTSFWNGSGDIDVSGNTKPPTIQKGVLPDGIRFASMNGGDDPNQQNQDSPNSVNESVDVTEYVKQATFLPDGTAVDETTVTIRAVGSRALVVKVRAVTGGITVGPAETEGGQP